ncbi:LamG-like jellyroll fold domain-containing protein, partial [Winogradskyella bathintestinalis]
YSVTDASGNSINVFQNINILDNTDPTASNPADIDVQCLTDVPAVDITVVIDEADNCGTPTVAFVSQTADPAINNGTIIRTYSVTDASGNSINVFQNINILDNTDPTASNPADIDVQCLTDVPAVDITVVTDESDNCTGPIIVAHVSDISTGFNPEVITRTYSVTDASNNSINVTQIITVEDTTPPVVICQPLTITLDALGSASITTAQIDNGSTDNCGISSRFLDIQTFNCSDLGTNTVTLSVIDDSDNINSCTTTVTVLDPGASSSVAIVSNDANDEICLGENLTFTATPVNAGTTQFYDWYINGSFESTTAGPTFTPSSVPTADYTIFVRMTTDLSTCDPKQSNTLSIEVHPLPVVSVSTLGSCIDDNSQSASPSTGGTWVSNNLGVATISNSGNITPVSPGTVTFTFTDATTGCSNTTNSVTIDALPVIGNYPTANEICEGETHTLSPSTGGTWTSSNNAVATINNAGDITGVGTGTATFTFTNSTTGCTATSTSIEVLEIPVITSVTASPNSVCAGDDSILTVTVPGTGSTTDVLVNYNFNSGSNYGNSNGQEAPGIISTINSSNINYNRSAYGRAITTPPAFVANNRGRALVQFDDWQDGPESWWNPGGSDDSGNWTFALGGTALPIYENFEIYFDAKRMDAGGLNKSIIVEYSTNNGASWNAADTPARLLNAGTGGPDYNDGWFSYYSTLSGVANVNNLQIRLSVNDGSTYSTRIRWWAVEYIDRTNPHVLIDNFQVQAASAAPANVTYNWAVVSGDNSSLSGATNLPQITVNPNVTTIYEVTATNTAGCPVADTVVVNVLPSPEITFLTNFCPSAPHNNEVEITAVSSIPGTTWQWIVTYLNPGDPGYTHGGHSNTSDTAFVDTAGTYQVIATAPNGCTASATIDIATELVVNGDFELGNTGFNSDYNYKVDLPGLVPANQGELYNDNGNNGYSITTNGQNVHTNFWGYDHTTSSGNFMAVNGHGNTLVVWQQEITVEPNTEYYFSAWGMSLNNQGNWRNRAQLTFNVNGTNVGIAERLPNRANNNNPGTDNWQRFYGTWLSPNWSGPQTITIEIRNLNSRTNGNDFGIDDISFSSLDPFIIPISPPEIINDQIVCQNTAIEDIYYNVGGGSSGANIQWQLDGSNLGTSPFPNNTMPAGMITTFDGVRYTISGTPSLPGNYTYTLSTTGGCGTPKTSSGKIVVNEAPLVSIITLPQTICQSENTLALNVTLSGSATIGTWSSSGTGTFTGGSGNGTSAIYNFGTNEIGSVTLTFTSNDPDGAGINGPCIVAEASIDIEITPYFVATTSGNQITGGCEVNSVTLTGNNVTGQWNVTSGQDVNTYFFSNINDHNATFTGESGETYILEWEAINTGVCTANTVATMNVTIPDCGSSLVFDGGDDYINFGDNYNPGNGQFSIEAWIKPDNFSGTKTIFSKRNGTSTASGYDLSLEGNSLKFRYNNSAVIAGQDMNTNKWYHVAVTFSGTRYSLYIDGFQVRLTAGASPLTNTNKALVGAMDRTGNSPMNYFDGGIDEVRIWNTELSQAQIREMMNQEIKQNDANANVMGEVVPLDITGPLAWNNLRGYYQMNTGPQTSVTGGNVNDISTFDPVPGKLNAMTVMQDETAPIPYISRLHNSWDNATTWSASSVQQIPNSIENNIRPGYLQTWNIVRTATNVTTYRSTPANLLLETTVLGLIVDSDRLSIGNDQPLNVEKYLKIDGTLDLVGESQLVQPMGSRVDYSGVGSLERDQQGTTNLYNYNYWSSPVSDDGTTYTIAGTLLDGTNPANPQPITWINGHDAIPSTPISITRRWLYLYENYLANNYAAWNRINENHAIKVGLGYLMKGSAGAGTSQNYVFKGQPNNGKIEIEVTGGHQALVGNPYPSALDAYVFIDNNNTVLKDGSISFWEHAPSNNTHVYRDYQGSYAVLNRTGAVAAVTPTGILGGGNAEKRPGQFIPVAQGFYVTGNNTGGQITFDNNQRVYFKEGPSSVFLRNANPTTQTTSTNDNEEQNQFIRIDFITPENATRHLLIGFMDNDNATDAFDYGYDALNTETLPSDMSFNIEGEKYVIQGVGHFDVAKSYPLDIVTEGGAIEIALDSLENFDEAIDVFIYDNVLGTYTRFNDVNFQMNLEAGTYSDRFFLVFQEDETLSVIKDEFDNVIVRYLHQTNEIYVKTPPSVEVKQLYLINVAGQTVASWNATNLPMSHDIKIPVKHISEGAYIIKAETNTGVFNRKIIIKY